jgi:SHS2 domain-containing protein
VYAWVEHTSELELSIAAPTEAGVFREALAAFAELSEDGAPAPAEERIIELVAPDRASLLAEWLDELVYLADAQQFLAEDVVNLELGGDRLLATVRGRRGEPSALVKAVTRHRLAFERGGNGSWHARVVLDV